MRRRLTVPRRAAARVSRGFDRLPIRVRLAGVSALLTFVILCAFAIGVGSLTVQRIRKDFNHDVLEKAEQLSSSLRVSAALEPGKGLRLRVLPELVWFALPGEHAVVRIFSIGGAVLEQEPESAPWFGQPRRAASTLHNYRVISRPVIATINGGRGGIVVIQYARSIAETEATVHRVEVLLLLGVLIGSGLALVAGLMIARRAIAPIKQLTQTAPQIARTRDPSVEIPEPVADDEVAELARTLESMLRELDAAREETEMTLARQRQFVADASHELRTPLTSVLANLELLAESLHGEQGDAATSALRSSQRMRRLVADLLLLARRDAAQEVAHAPCDLARIVVEAAGELGPVSEQHSITLDVQPARVDGARDELHRLAVNLLENALRHTPPGTEVRASTTTTARGEVELIVEDDGPGVDPELAPSLFERFVRGSRDRGGSFGLGLAIVQAIAESHGGSVALGQGTGLAGACFVVRLPACSDLDDDGQDHRPPLQTVVN